MMGRLRTPVTIVCVLVVAAFVVLTVRDQDWSLLAALTSPGALALIGGALLANAAGLWLGMLSWRALLAGLGTPVRTPAAARIFFVGLLAKFVPGRVWTLVTNIRMGASAGVPPARMTAAYVLAIVVGSLTGLTAGILAAPAVLGPHAPWVALAAVPVVAFLVRPGLAYRAAVAAARLLRRGEPQRPSDGSVRTAIAAQGLSWVTSGLHLWLLAVAAGAPPLTSLAVCVGAFGVAFVAGNLMVLVPDGLGVRESLLLAALATVLPLSQAGTVVLMSRVVCTLSEVLVAGAAVAAAQLRIRRENRKEERAPWPISTSQSSSTTTPPTSAA